MFTSQYEEHTRHIAHHATAVGMVLIVAIQMMWLIKDRKCIGRMTSEAGL
jgi:hypothetical protein